ncbi:MAG: DegV family protein [Coriobacteriales bacterium]|nr:DegV family protein [Actinomycetes bacterium]
MKRVGIVCDSTCDLGPDWLAEHDVVMVPLKVLFGEATYLDWIDLSPEDFYDKLESSPTLSKTSQPSPAEFSAVYETLASNGCEGIVSIHLSAQLSGTCESAHLAAATSRIPVVVIDTKLVSAAEALVVEAAIKARDAGGDLDTVTQACNRVVDSTRLLFALDTLEYLVKGGRAGKAQGLAASMLNIKPVLTFNSEGIIEPFKNMKGTKKAIQGIAEQVAKDSASQPVRLVLLHSLAPELLDEMKAALENAKARYILDGVCVVGAVIGTYAGRGAIGVAYHPEE